MLSVVTEQYNYVLQVHKIIWSGLKMLFWKSLSFVHYDILHVLPHGVRYFNLRHDSVVKHSLFYNLSSGTEMLWAKIAASVCEVTMCILLFSHFTTFYNIGTLSCILGTYQLCTKLFFTRDKHCCGKNSVRKFTWCIESLVKVQEVFKKEKRHSRTHGGKPVTP